MKVVPPHCAQGSATHEEVVYTLEVEVEEDEYTGDVGFEDVLLLLE